MAATARAPSGERTTSGPPAREACRTAASTQPAPRTATEVGGPATSTSSTTRFGATEWIAAEHPGRAHDSQDPCPVGPEPGGDGRALRSEANHVLPGEEDADRTLVRVGQAPGNRADLRRGLAAEGAAIRQRRRRLSAGPAPGGIGLQVGRLDPRRAQDAVPAAGRYLERPRGGRGRTPPLHLPCHGARFGQGLPHHPFAVRTSQSDECVQRGGVVGEPAHASGHRGADGLRNLALERSAPGRGGDVPAAALIEIKPERGLTDRLPAGAAAQVGQQGLVDGRPHERCPGR